MLKGCTKSSIALVRLGYPFLVGVHHPLFLRPARPLRSRSLNSRLLTRPTDYPTDIAANQGQAILG